MRGMQRGFDRHCGTVAQGILGWAARHLEPSHRLWIDALRGELDLVGGGPAQLLWALGGLSIVFTTRRRSMARPWNSPLTLRYGVGERLYGYDAIAAFRKALGASPSDVDAWSGIAFADSELHQYADELHALSMRSKYAPDNPPTLFLWATAYDNLHQSKAAADYYHRFLAAAQGKYPDQEWQAKHRLVALGK